ncbi:unnamed protein product [Effrenium voratum]|nr:unnamed protein product [Effrenium voratum]
MTGLSLTLGSEFGEAPGFKFRGLFGEKWQQVLYQFSAWACAGPGLGFLEDPRPAMKAPHGAGSFAVQGPRPLPASVAGHSLVGD